MNYLKDCRVKRLWSQKELARRSDVSQVTICHIETGVSPNPTDLVKQKLANAFKVPRERLFPPSESPLPISQKRKTSRKKRERTPVQ